MSLPADSTYRAHRFVLLCPICSSPEIKVLQTVRRASGKRWRRRYCTDCEHRWTDHDEAAFEPTPRRRIIGRAAYECRSLTDWQAAQIIVSPDSERTLAGRYGISRASVNAIRRGDSYRNVWQLLQQLRPDPPET